MMPGQVVDQALAFWERAGFTVPFPRDLIEPVSWTLPLTIVMLPRLEVRDAEAHLARHHLPVRLADQNRQVLGCLVMAGGKGFVFIDGAAPADERRFTIAHEVAHYLCEYQQPRERAIARAGPQLADVLDGLRPPAVTERAAAALAGVPLGTHVHLMERGPEGTLGCAATLGAETRADLLALELLAPETAVLQRMHAAGLPPTHANRVKLAEALLMRDFGLPAVIAAGYAPHLCRSAFGGPSFREWLAG